MRATVTLTSRGVVTLPAKLRQALGQWNGAALITGRPLVDALIAEATPEGLLLRPAVTLPVEMYTPQREREFDAAEADLAAGMALRDRVVAAPARLVAPAAPGTRRKAGR